jgi:hypothetical protein
MTADELYALVRQAADAEGRLPLPPMTGWEIFPFERDSLRTVPLAPPELPEPARDGEGDRPCRACAQPEPALWSDDHWRLRVLPESGAPLVLMLLSADHVDLTGLSDARAAELGRLIVHISRAVETLPNIARAHVSRWGDGGAHLHVIFFARPAGFRQLRGACFPLWDDLLPAGPPAQRAADAASVARAVAASYGGVVAR